MKKVITLAAFLVAIVAHAEYYLYWEYNPSKSGDASVEFSYAKIQVSGGDIVEPQYLTLDTYGDVTFDDISPSDGKAPDYNGTMISPTYVDITEYANSAYSFALELYSVGNPDQMIRLSDYVSFTQLKNFGNVYENMATTGHLAYNFRVRPTPEPTSGLLVLLGIGALALRRKRVHGASTLRHGASTFRHGEATSWSPLSSYT